MIYIIYYVCVLALLSRRNSWFDGQELLFPGGSSGSQDGVAQCPPLQGRFKRCQPWWPELVIVECNPAKR